MNPFTESTVARPLVSPRRRVAPVAAKLSGKRKRRSRVGMTLGAMGLATSLGLPAISLPVLGSPVAGTFATTAGILAAVFVPRVAQALDVNAATQEQLRGVRGIGPKTAQIIIEERGRGGRYESLEDLSDRVKGIGSKKAAALQAAGLSVSASGASPPAAAGALPPSAAIKPVAPAASSRKPSGPSGGRTTFRLPSPGK
jgi:competence protein ComEA